MYIYVSLTFTLLVWDRVYLATHLKHFILALPSNANHTWPADRETISGMGPLLFNAGLLWWNEKKITICIVNSDYDLIDCASIILGQIYVQSRMWMMSDNVYFLDMHNVLQRPVTNNDFIPIVPNGLINKRNPTNRIIWKVLYIYIYIYTHYVFMICVPFTVEAKQCWEVSPTEKRTNYA